MCLLECHCLVFATYINVCAHMLTHTHTHARTHARTCKNTLHLCTDVRARAHTHTCSTHTCSTHTCSTHDTTQHTHTHTHTHTNTHTGACFRVLPLSTRAKPLISIDPGISSSPYVTVLLRGGGGGGGLKEGRGLSQLAKVKNVVLFATYAGKDILQRGLAVSCKREYDRV
jgi:hypothetical protein